MKYVSSYSRASPYTFLIEQDGAELWKGQFHLMLAKIASLPDSQMPIELMFHVWVYLDAYWLKEQDAQNELTRRNRLDKGG